MHSVVAEIMPGALIANILWKENVHRPCEFRILGKSSCHQPRPGCVEHVEFGTKYCWNCRHHRCNPGAVLLRTHAIFNDRAQERVAGGCAKRIITDFPIHLILRTEV